MNNEKYNQIIDEAYENYSKEYEKDNSVGLTLLVQMMDGSTIYRKPNREMFVGMCTYDKLFSEKWGLEIEERGLSLLERYELMKKLDNWVSVHYKEPKTMEYMDSQNIPTKLITLTYNNETTEVYE